jgi:uncharacterized protein (TIGR03790 family)
MHRWRRPADPVLILLLVVGLLAVMRGATAQDRPRPVSPASVLVVKNLNSPDSVAIADYYERKRRLPADNVCSVRCPVVEECSQKEYEDQLEQPVQRFLAHLNRSIDYIVLTKGIPIRTHEGNSGGFSVDSLLVVMDIHKPNGNQPLVNPYFRKMERFSHARYGMYLVTRLIGYTRADCLRLVDDSLAARPYKGPFLIHVGPGHNDGGYKPVNDGMRRASEILTRKGLDSILSIGDGFAGGYKNLMGYFSWGSNDLKYDKHAYNSLGFVPGGIAETAVSTSARTFADPRAPGQSLIADLVAQGVTGCKGYVSEPYASAIAYADILFDRYTSGYTLAESFYMASIAVRWKDLVVGDPICAPYASQAVGSRQ